MWFRASPGASSGPARFLVAVEPQPGLSRRDLLAALSRWARRHAAAFAALPAAAPLYRDLRALGFEDAGPLARYSAPVRPGRLRRALAAAFLPAAPVPSDISMVPEAVSADRWPGLGRTLAPAFGALARPLPDAPPSGVHLRRDGKVVAAARFARKPVASGAVLRVREWMAPAEAPELTAALFAAVLRAAAAHGAGRVTAETCHAGLGTGLRLARLLPGRSRARVLMRPKSRGGPLPQAGGWHFPVATRLSPPLV